MLKLSSALSRSLPRWAAASAAASPSSRSSLYPPSSAAPRSASPAPSAPARRTMAGHSKWANIQRQKGRTDAKRGAELGRLSKGVISASRQCSGDMDDFTLKDAILKAKEGGLPKDRIGHAVAKGSGVGMKGEILESNMYEATGPGGVAFMIDALTDNKRRTASELRAMLVRHDAALGSTAWMFDRRGRIFATYGGGAEGGGAGGGGAGGKGGGKGAEAGEAAAAWPDDVLEGLFDAALEAGAEDVGDEVDETGAVEVWCDPANLTGLRAGLGEAGYPGGASGVVWMPNVSAQLESDADANVVADLIDALEEHDDVVALWHNAEFPDVVEEE